MCNLCFEAYVNGMCIAICVVCWKAYKVTLASVVGVDFVCKKCTARTHQNQILLCTGVRSVRFQVENMSDNGDGRAEDPQYDSIAMFDNSVNGAIDAALNMRKTPNRVYRRENLEERVTRMRDALYDARDIFKDGALEDESSCVLAWDLCEAAEYVFDK